MNKLTNAITLTLISALAMSCTEARSRNIEAAIPVKIQAVEGHSLNSNTVRYSATIRPATQMDLAFKSGGFVDSIFSVGGRTVDQGDMVTQVTLLARLRPADFQNRLDQLNSQLMEARFALEAAKSRADDAQAKVSRTEKDFRRAEQLFNTESLTRPNYDAAVAEYDSARAKLESAKADIDGALSRIRASEAAVADAKLAIHDAALLAPMSGTIVERDIEQGSLVGAGRKAFVLSDTRTVKAVFGVPDTEIQHLRLGMLLTLTSEALPERTFSGRITSIAPAADEKSRIFETEVTLANPGGVLKPGMIASVAMNAVAAPESVAAIPLSAIVRSADNPDNYAVYVIDTGSGGPLARRRNVSLGEPVGNMISVKDGLGIGETVISVGATLVRDGSAVQIVP